MGAKIVQVSADNGVTYYTLPGNSGEFNNEAGAINDTVFGQNYMSNQSGLISWTLSANALYKGFAGYVATIKQSGTPIAMTAEVMSLVSGKTYKVTSAIKQILDINTAVTVLDNGVNQTSNVLSIDYLFGTITFKPAYTPTGPVTITGKYVPVSNFGRANSFTLTQTANLIDNSSFGTVQANQGYRTFEQGLKTVSLELSGFFDATQGIRDKLKARGLLLMEMNPDGNSKSVARGFFKLSSQGQSGDVGALEEESINLDLSVPSSDYLPFNWAHTADTTLNQAVRIVLNAWLTGTAVKVRYLPDGVNGVEGLAIIAETSMNTSLDGMNEFSVSFQGTDITTNVGTG